MAIENMPKGKIKRIVAEGGVVVLELSCVHDRDQPAHEATDFSAQLSSDQVHELISELNGLLLEVEENARGYRAAQLENYVEVNQRARRARRTH
ncbi:hypothetical protein R69746_08414 [Paraburkholderia aspalathi]|nr:hypothetical protein R69746_08414 [Paraburkholderia aspalathi]